METHLDVVRLIILRLVHIECQGTGCGGDARRVPEWHPVNTEKLSQVQDVHVV